MSVRAHGCPNLSQIVYPVTSTTISALRLPEGGLGTQTRIQALVWLVCTIMWGDSVARDALTVENGRGQQRGTIAGIGWPRNLLTRYAP
jgi:hypothetical protein